jgi:peptidoglycan/xylan/chitin deacetylase (PgdA/CDA1 family)
MNGRWLTVLTYHRIAELADDPDDLDPALVSAGPLEFQNHVAWLAANATPVSLDDVLAARAGGAELPRRAVLVTFDDGYADFAEVAWPVLRAHGVPAVVFVATAYPGSLGHGFWWDRLHRALARTDRREPLPTPLGLLPLATAADRERAHSALVPYIHALPHDDAMRALERLVALLGDADSVCPVLSWPQLRELAGEGVTVAPHTRTHARLDRVTRERADAEIAGSRADVERELGHCPAAFAFPAGGHDDQAGALLREHGFALGFTTRRGPNDLRRADWLRLNRTNVGRRSTVRVLRAQLRPLAARALGAVVL